MKILFANLSPVRFDVSTPEKESLGGTESCVAYLAAELARTDEVWLLANTQTSIIKSVRHFSLSNQPDRSFFQSHRFDVIIVVSAPGAVPLFRSLSPASRIVLWNHELPDQQSLRPMANAEVVRALDDVIHVSDWQCQQTEALLGASIPSRVIGNAIAPCFEDLFADRTEFLAVKEMRGAYTSTPYRGLAVLLDAHARLTTPLRLDVFSSMQVYRQDDAPFEALYERARANPDICYHGSISQTKLAAAMRRTSFLTYPCIYPETFCITAVEAMAVGATVITTDLGALRSTTLGFGELLPIASSSAGELAASYAGFIDALVSKVRDSREQWAERMLEQIAVVNRECVWRRRADQWRAFFAESKDRRLQSRQA